MARRRLLPDALALMREESDGQSSRLSGPTRAGDRPDQGGNRPQAEPAPAAAVAAAGGGTGDRKSVVLGKSVSVRGDLGGRRIIKKKNKQTSTNEMTSYNSRTPKKNKTN